MSVVTFRSAPTQSVAEIRASFPALERRHGGVPVAYFDGPGGTQVPRNVVNAMESYLYHITPTLIGLILPARRPTRFSGQPANPWEISLVPTLPRSRSGPI